jgi:hypothetical protein
LNYISCLYRVDLAEEITEEVADKVVFEVREAAAVVVGDIEQVLEIEEEAAVDTVNVLKIVSETIIEKVEEEIINVWNGGAGSNDPTIPEVLKELDIIASKISTIFRKAEEEESKTFSEILGLGTNGQGHLVAYAIFVFAIFVLIALVAWLGRKLRAVRGILTG